MEKLYRKVAKYLFSRRAELSKYYVEKISKRAINLNRSLMIDANTMGLKEEDLANILLDLTSLN